MRISYTTAVVMLSLGHGPLRPAALIRSVAQAATYVLNVGELFAVLDRMVGQGLVYPAASADGRKPYELTGKGRVELQSHLDGQHGPSTRRRNTPPSTSKTVSS